MTEASSTESLAEQLQRRRDKLTEWRAAMPAYPNGVRPSHTAAALHATYASATKADLEATPVQVRVAGRIMMRRMMGKASFVQLQDGDAHIQLYVRTQELGAAQYDVFKQWDLGDIVYAEGHLFRTKTGELSVWCQQVTLLTKALHPLPDKYHGLQDVEARYRQRYLDLMSNPETLSIMKMRSDIVRLVRAFFHEHDFTEVETPMMQRMPGGASARPFSTHLNALDLPMYLRIAPELYLKRLVVGGMHRVFELNRNFRNEGMSTRHNPEFTMVEFYQAYATYHDMMDLTEALFDRLLTTLFATKTLTYGADEIDFSTFRRVGLAEILIETHAALDAKNIRDRAALMAVAETIDLVVAPSWGVGKIQLEIFEKTIEKTLIQPTFITDYPQEVSPLARASDDDPFLTDRFELFIAGRELANGFSELNDPEDQSERFRQQVAMHEAGDDEAMLYDADFVTALEYGMPPTAGQGIGIDRLVMLLTNTHTIRDVILFPMMRPASA